MNHFTTELHAALRHGEAKALAAALNTSESQLSKIRNGTAGEITTATFRTIIDFFPDSQRRNRLIRARIRDQLSPDDFLRVEITDPSSRLREGSDHTLHEMIDAIAVAADGDASIRSIVEGLYALIREDS